MKGSQTDDIYLERRCGELRKRKQSELFREREYYNISHVTL